MKPKKLNPVRDKSLSGVKIDLPDYRKIASSIKRNKISITENEVEQALKFLQFSRAKLGLKKGPAKKGDWVEIEFSSAEIEGGRQFKDAFILGQGHLASGFEENLEGLEANQEKSFSLSFAKTHFRKDLAGKQMDFRVKMIAVKNVEAPEINDDFARNLGRFENLASLKTNIESGLRREKEIAENWRIKSLILEKISQRTNFPIPQTLIEKQRNHLMKNLKTRVNKGLKTSFDDYLKKIKKTERELAQDFSETAQKGIKNFLILKEIAQREQIEAGESEIKQRINETLKNYAQKPEHIDLQRLKEYTKDVIIQEKVFDFLEKLCP